MYPTRNTLPERKRAQIVGYLQGHLANSIDLMTQAKQAHWNVKGRQFIALHKLFDEIAEDFAEYVDLIAERIVQLGGVAEGTVHVVADRSELPEYPLELSDGLEHVHALSHSLAAYGESVRDGIDKADEFDDKDTADIFTEISRGTDKYLWFVEAHAQGEHEAFVEFAPEEKRAPKKGAGKVA